MGYFMSFLHMPQNQGLSEGHGWGNFVPCMMLAVSGLRSPSPCAHRSSLGEAELGLFSDGAAKAPAPGWEPRQAGEGRKSCPLSRALAAQLPGDRRAGHAAGCFVLVVWEPAVIFLIPYSTKPGQTASSTAQLQLTDLLL